MRNIIFLHLLTSLTAIGQDLPDFLKESESNSILLKDEVTLTISDIRNSVTSRSYTAIIKNKRASHLKNVYIYYDQFNDVKDAEVIISDLLGKEIEKYKLKDFEDVALGLSNTASDGRLKLLEPTYARYPVKIEVKYSIAKSGSLHFPSWQPQQDDKIRVLSSKFIVKDFSKNSFRYYSVKLDEPEKNSTATYDEYKWEANDLAPYKYEDYNYDIEDYTPILYTAPNNFEVDGFVGDMSSWESFGNWSKKLNEGKNDLNLDLLTDLDEKVSKAEDEFEKIKVIYEYLQNNTRYVSIQLGIGGWQPFSASYVQEKRYGDCKALSFFTKSLLEKYGINGYYTLIRAGSYEADVKPEFPNAHFNHAILTVPIETDTIFLECTSQTNPFGYMGKFTSDRNALMITEDGGKLIRTKKYNPAQNLQQTLVEISLKDDGTAKVNFKRQYSGLEIDNHGFSRLYHGESDEPFKWFVDNHSFGSLEVSKVELIELKEGFVPEAGYKASFEVAREAKKMGKRYFIQPDKYIRSYVSKLTPETREKGIKIKYGYAQKDSIIYSLPGFMSVESSLEKVTIENKFGVYKRQLVKAPDSDKYIYTREFTLNDGNYSKEEYESFKAFINAVVKYDNQRLVLIDKT